MRLKHMLIIVGLTLTVIQGMPSADAMPQIDPPTSQFSSQFPSNTASAEVRQSAFDPLEIDSGFWRTEYTTRPAKQDPTTNDNDTRNRRFRRDHHRDRSLRFFRKSQSVKHPMAQRDFETSTDC